MAASINSFIALTKTAAVVAVDVGLMKLLDFWLLLGLLGDFLYREIISFPLAMIIARC